MEPKIKNKAAVALARLRAKRLTPERRKEIGRAAIAARWAKKRLLETPGAGM